MLHTSVSYIVLYIVYPVEEVLRKKEIEKQNTRTSKPTPKVERKGPTGRANSTAEQEPVLAARRSVREPRQSEKLKALSGVVASPKRAAPARRRKPTARTSNTSVKRSLFDGVMLSRRQSSKDTLEGENQAAGPSEQKTFAQIAEDADEGMDIALETI
jgi:hypothetical protein